MCNYLCLGVIANLEVVGFSSTTKGCSYIGKRMNFRIRGMGAMRTFGIIFMFGSANTSFECACIEITFGLPVVAPPRAGRLSRVTYSRPRMDLLRGRPAGATRVFAKLSGPAQLARCGSHRVAASHVAGAGAETQPNNPSPWGGNVPLVSHGPIDPRGPSFKKTILEDAPSGVGE